MHQPLQPVVDCSCTQWVCMDTPARLTPAWAPCMVENLLQASSLAMLSNVTSVRAAPCERASWDHPHTHLCLGGMCLYQIFLRIAGYSLDPHRRGMATAVALQRPTRLSGFIIYYLSFSTDR